MNRLEQYIIRNKRVWPCPDQESALIAGSGSATYCITKTDFLERIAEENRPSFSDHPDAKCFACDRSGGWFKSTLKSKVEINGSTWVNSERLSTTGWVYLQKGNPIGGWKESLDEAPKDFNKADLRDGMKLTFRCGDTRYFLQNDTLNLVLGEWCNGLSLNDFNETLIYPKDPDVDIVKVMYMGELIWERPEPKPTTEQIRISTIRKKMEELASELKELEQKA